MAASVVKSVWNQNGNVTTTGQASALAQGVLDAQQGCANENPQAALATDYQGPLPQSENDQIWQDLTDAFSDDN